MNIVLSSDDNYARHLGQTMVSIMENNTSEDRIVFYILNVGLSEENIDKLIQVSKLYDREIVIVDFSDIRSKLKLDNIPVLSFSIEAYSKFFLAEALPESADRALWIDGDTDVLASIHDLYYCDMGDCVAAGVVDQPNFGIDFFRKDADIKDGPYFAIGMFVADLAAWRREKMSEQFINYFVERNGNLGFLEQATMNHVLYKRFYKLPLQCHVITPTWFLTYKQLLSRWGEPFYTKEEYEQARKHPIIIHYTVFRPWKQWCMHPKRRYYRKYIKMTPWKDVPLEKASLFGLVKGRFVSLFGTIKRKLVH